MASRWVFVGEVIRSVDGAMASLRVQTQVAEESTFPLTACFEKGEVVVQVSAHRHEEVKARKADLFVRWGEL